MNYDKFDQLLTPVLVINDKNEIIYFNHICTTFFHLSPRKIKNYNNIASLLKTTDTDLVKKIEETRSTNSAHVTKELSVNVSEVNVQYTVIMKLIPHEKDIIVNIEDFSIEKHLHEKYKLQVNELKETHQEILKSDKLRALGELTAGISHEIASPLTIISDLLLQVDEYLVDHKSKAIEKFFTGIKTEFLRVNQIIGSMQQASKNDDDHYEVIPLKELVDKALDFLEDFNHLNGIDISTKCESNIYALVNPIKIEQVFVNIIKNAVDALRNANVKDPKIDIIINTNEAESTYEVHIKDNGPGIDDKDKDKIFEMFFTTKGDTDGTGLGLPICQKTLQSHNGEIILCDSSKGAHFNISFPSIELQSFTETNLYLRGKSDNEDQKVLVFSNDYNKLNDVFRHMKGKKYVSILCYNEKELKNNIHFFLADYIISLDKVKLPDLKKIKAMDYTELNTLQLTKKLEEDFK